MNTHSGLRARGLHFVGAVLLVFALVATFVVHNTDAVEAQDATASSELRVVPDFDSAIDYSKDFPTPRNVFGTLRGHVAFVQSTYVDPTDPAADPTATDRPNLVPGRTSLMLFTPEDRSLTEITAKVNGNTYEMRSPREQPGHNGTTGNEGIVFSKRAWSVRVDAKDIKVGMTIEFHARGRTGKTRPETFNFGPPGEATYIAMRVGVLAPIETVNRHPWSDDEWGTSPTHLLQYYNTTPIQKMRSAYYEDVELTRVVVPKVGVKPQAGETIPYVEYTERSEDLDANVHNGDLRVWITNVLIPGGIAKANLGIPSDTRHEDFRPERLTATVMSTNAYVNPANGGTRLVKHGLRGVSGQLNLLRATYNEWTHEAGHDWTFPHWKAGTKYASHDHEGGWGYDPLADRYNTNLVMGHTPRHSATNDLPWDFSADAMSGGGWASLHALFPQYSSKAQQWIQNSNVQKWFDPRSETVYSSWDAAAQRVVPVSDPYTKEHGRYPRPAQRGVPVTTIVGNYDPQGEQPSWVANALHGNWGAVFDPSEMNKVNRLTNSKCELTVTGRAGARVFKLDDTRLDPNGYMNYFHVNVPQSMNVRNATVTCNGTTLVSQDLEGPKTTMRAPMTIDGTYDSMIEVSLRQSALDFGGTTTSEALARMVETRYGQVLNDVAPKERGRVYRLDDGYYQWTGQDWKQVASDTQVGPEYEVGVGEATPVLQAELSISAWVDPWSEGVIGSQTPASPDKTKGGETAPYAIVEGTDEFGNTASLRFRWERVEDPSADPNKWAKRGSYRAVLAEQGNEGVEPGSYRVDFPIEIMRRRERSLNNTGTVNWLTESPFTRIHVRGIVDVGIERIGLDEDSRNYNPSRTNVVFTVPEDQPGVATSTVSNRGRWYDGTESGTVVANAVGADGQAYQVTLKVQKNRQLIPNTGQIVGAKASFSATVVDTSLLPVGVYDIDFYADARGWHNRDFHRRILVRDHLVVDGSAQTIGLDQDSSDFQKAGTNVYFTVPEGQAGVATSTVSTRGRWYDGTESGTVVANATAGDGRVYPVTLKVQKNRQLIPNTGQVKTAPATFSAVVDSSTRLPEGVYEIDFYARADGWHDRTFKGVVRVRDHIIVGPEAEQIGLDVDS